MHHFVPVKQKNWEKKICKKGKKLTKKIQKQENGEKKQRPVAIDSCRRTSDPCVNFMCKWKVITWEMSLLQDSFQRCLSFLFSFCKSHLSFTSISCLKFKEIDIYNRNVVWKKDKFHLPSNMDMKILQNEDVCYFQNSGIDQCCHTSIF